MSKERKRGNREIRKPKQKKQVAMASVAPTHGLAAAIGLPKKKR